MLRQRDRGSVWLLDAMMQANGRRESTHHSESTCCEDGSHFKYIVYGDMIDHISYVKGFLVTFQGKHCISSFINEEQGA